MFIYYFFGFIIKCVSGRIFKVLGTNVSDCGFREKLTETIKVVDPSEGKMEVWNMWQKEGALYPYKIVRRYMNHGLPVFEVFWVYKSSTDSYEYFDNIVDFGRQYPRSCQAAEDHAARNHGTY